jgi:outer membrane immunogenic protein
MFRPIAFGAALCCVLPFASAYAAGPGMIDGPYAGFTVGAGITNFVDESYDWYGGPAGGILAGGQIGFNRHAGPAVFGIEADATWSNKAGDAQWNNAYRHDWEASLRARIGFDTIGFTPYLTAGVAVGALHATYNDTSYVKVGWTVGIGAEMALTDRLSGALEYRHTDFGSNDYGYILHPQDDSVRLSFNYHFGR